MRPADKNEVMTRPERGLRLWLATLLLLAQVLGTPVLRAMPCAGGGPEICCCAAQTLPVADRHGCCGDEAPEPEEPAPCGCHQVPAPTPVPVPDPTPRVADAATVGPSPIATSATPTSEAVAIRPVPEPRARNGPLLHVRLCVFLD